jgi:hypothetical protein
LNSSREGEVIYLDYTPSTFLERYDFGNITVNAKEFANGFVYISLGNKDPSVNRPRIDESSYKTIILSLTIEDNHDVITAGFYDANGNTGWGGFPSQVIEI